MKIKYPQLSLSLKFSLSFGTIFLLTAFAFEMIVYEASEHFMEKEVDSSLKTDVDGLSEVYYLGGANLLKELLERRVQFTAPDTKIYLLADADYNKVVGNVPGWPKYVPKQSGWSEVDEDSGPEVLKDIRYLHVKLDKKYHLLVGQDTIKQDELEDELFYIIILGLFLSLSGGGIVGLILHRSLKRRLELITATCSEIMLGRFSHRIPVSKISDEIDAMAHTLNTMLERIESLMKGIRHVTDNVAHDLRTPLTRLRGRLEILSSLTENDSSREFVEAALGEVDQLLITFSALLSIARLESGELENTFTQVQMRALIKDVIEIYEPIAEDKGQKILLRDTAGDFAVLGDRDLITQCFSNLIDNGIKYGPVDSVITIQLLETDADVSVNVHDQGKGIPEGEHSKVLERFYRVEASRNLPGNGLGLPLVSAVVAMHRGQLKLQNINGFQAVITFPKA